MQDILTQIWGRAQEHRDEIISGLRDYIAAQEGGEPAVQAMFSRNAEALGCAVEASTYNPAEVILVEEFANGATINPKPRTSVVAHLKGVGSARSLILFAHPDSEAFRADSGWKQDPLKGEIVDGKLYGWGVADDLSGIAAGLQAIALLNSLGLRPLGEVLVASTPSKRHARGVSHVLQHGLSADAVVYLHPAESGVGMKEIKAFTSGQIEFRIEIEGLAPPTTEPHQTAFAHKGVNAIEKAILLVQALRALDEERASMVRHPALEGEIGRSTNLMVSFIHGGNEDRLSRGADRCILGAAIAFPPFEKLENVRAAIEAAIERVTANDPWLAIHPPKILWDAGVAGAEVPADHELVKAAVSSIEAICGFKPWINPMHTGSDIRNPMVQKNIPTIGLGPLCGNLTQNGASDEWVDSEDHVRFVATTAMIIAKWCGVAPLERASRQHQT